MPPPSGDKWYLATGQSSLGDELRLSGDYKRAGQSYEEALSLLRPLGKKEDQLADLHNLAYVRLHFGQLDEPLPPFPRLWHSVSILG